MDELVEPKTTRLKGKFRPPTDGSPMPSLSFTPVTREARGDVVAEEAAEIAEVWAPAWSDAWYLLKIIEKPDSGRSSIEASLTIPGVNSWELAEARVSRIGGRSRADREFEQWLYGRIGAAAVAGGRIEAAMKRLVLSMSGTLDPAFADAEDQWSTLEKKLRSAAESKGERAAEVIKLLDWGQEHGIREIRNDIVHAYWWDYAGAGVTRGRVYRDGTSELIIVTPAQLDSDCEKLQAYADGLDSAMEMIWLNIYFPRME